MIRRRVSNLLIIVVESEVQHDIFNKSDFQDMVFFKICNSILVIINEERGQKNFNLKVSVFNVILLPFFCFLVFMVMMFMVMLFIFL